MIVEYWLHYDVLGLNCEVTKSAQNSSISYLTDAFGDFVLIDLKLYFFQEKTRLTGALQSVLVGW